MWNEGLIWGDNGRSEGETVALKLFPKEPLPSSLPTRRRKERNERRPSKVKRANWSFSAPPPAPFPIAGSGKPY